MRRKPYSGPASDHFDGVRFFISGHATDKARSDFFKWSFGRDRARWPKHWPSPFEARPEPRVSGLRSTLIGHASFLLQINGANILIDPVYSRRASPVAYAGPKRANEPGIAFDDLPEIDIVLITHNHYDHLDLATLHRIEERWRPVFVMPLGVDYNLSQRHRWPKRKHVLDWRQDVSVKGIAIHSVPSFHWSARGVHDRRKTLWCSYVIESAAGSVYHIGDTSYGDGRFSKEVARLFRPITLAHIPIGAYEPRWFMKSVHCNPEEAVRLFQDCGAAHAIGHHWGTFQLTNEAHDRPPKDLQTALAAARIEALRFQAFRPGQVWEKP